MRRVALLLCLLLASACGASSAPPLLLPPSPTESPTTSPTPAPIPSFGTPQAAMIYLASAWNRRDLVELKHVTDPSARSELDAMHDEATNLKLDHCEANKGRGDYECFFTHDFPRGYKTTSKTGHGTAAFTVGPARRSGWYMTVFEYCGDGNGG